MTWVYQKITRPCDQRQGGKAQDKKYAVIEQSAVIQENDNSMGKATRRDERKVFRQGKPDKKAEMRD
jgi:hypothetical protein